MGNANSANIGLISAEPELAVLTPGSFTTPAKPTGCPLRFHSKHGDHVEISQDGTVARRVRSYCKAIVFTNRPVEKGEMVCFRIKEQSSKQQAWSGSLRIGITTEDPALLDISSALYLCPDLTSRQGFWAHPLPESFSSLDKIMHFQCLENRTIVFGVNGMCKGVVFDNVDTSQQLWAVFDVYGTTTAIELLDASVLHHINSRNFTRSIMMGTKNRLTSSTTESAPLTAPLPAPLPARNVMRTGSMVSSFTGSRPSVSQRGSPSSVHNYPVPEIPPRPLSTFPSGEDPSRTPPSTMPQSARPTVASHSASATKNKRQNSSSLSSSTPRSTSRHFAHLPLKTIRFYSELKGRNIVFSDDNQCARLAVGEFCNGYVFTPRAMLLNETLVMRILQTDVEFDGGLAFGLTTCDPAGLCQGHLPDDADNLLDRPEYWIVAKDVASRPKEGEEFAFTILRDGTVQISRNNSKPSDFLFVDSSQTFWMFFEVYGSTRKIGLLGCCNWTSGSSTNLPGVSTLTVDLPRPRLPSSASSSASSQPSSRRPHSTTALSATPRDLIDFHTDIPSPSDNPGSFSGGSPSYNLPSAATYAASAQKLTRTNSVPTDDYSRELREGECCICFEKQVNSVVYTCGHQVMCYDCAISQFQRGKPCPICRSPIKDIIKTFRT